MSLNLALDDISIDVDTLFHTIDCGIAADLRQLIFLESK